MQDLRTTRVLITGGGIRIGRAIAFAFARAGARVVVHYNRSERATLDLMHELEAIGPGHERIKANLLNAAERRNLIPSLLHPGKTLNCLVNNAAVYRRCPLSKSESTRFREDYEINFLAPFLLMRDFARYCDEGSIVNILDQRVALVDPSASAYGFAKKSLRDATEAAAVQWAPRVRVNAVAPGLVLPPRGVGPDKVQRLLSYVPMAQTSSPEEVAEACLFLARARTITGQVLYVDGGMHLVSPAMYELDEADYS